MSPTVVTWGRSSARFSGGIRSNCVGSLDPGPSDLVLQWLYSVNPRFVLI